MTFYTKLKNAWQQQDSLLCVGLDPELSRLPDHLKSLNEAFYRFCTQIVDATHDLVCAYKPQFAHFAAEGAEDQLANVIAYIRSTYPDIPVLLDAKRGDIGSTADFYAREAFERYNADAVTVSPYLGYDSVAPYLTYEDRGIVVLCRTSNAHSDWLQNYPANAPVFERVAEEVVRWNDKGQCMLVTGATYPAELKRVRKLVGEMPLLVPGVGAQGGNVAEVIANGADAAGQGLVISSSRQIIFAHEQSARTGKSAIAGNAHNGEDFAQAARFEATELRRQISEAKH